MLDFFGELGDWLPHLEDDMVNQMKTARLSGIETVQLACPCCPEGDMRSSDGSYLIHKEQVGTVVRCDWCAEQCIVPESAFKVKSVRK